jgi:hypothetical protein
VERHAPPDYREDREKLLQTLAGRFGPETYAFILAALVSAHALEGHWARDRQQRTKRSRYSRERRKIIEQLEAIARHPIVRSGPDPTQVVFYEPHELVCPHGRPRKRCEALGEGLVRHGAFTELLERVRRPGRARQFIQRQAAENLQRLQSLDPTVSADTPLENVCHARLTDLDNPNPAHTAAAAVSGPCAPSGRPPSRLAAISSRRSVSSSSLSTASTRAMLAGKSPTSPNTASTTR